MARFSVYAVKGLEGYVVEIQSDLLSHLTTRVVVPLLPEASAPERVRRMNPLFDMDGETFSLVTEHMVAVPVSFLGPKVADLAGQGDEITAAVDFLMQGF